VAVQVSRGADADAEVDLKQSHIKFVPMSIAWTELEYSVGWCSWTASKPVLKAPTVSAFSA